MYKTTRLISACLIATSLYGCSGGDFKPTADMSAEQIFAEACAGCHGDNGEGKFGFLLSIAGSRTPDEEITEKILHGGHFMPAFRNLSASDANALAAFLKRR